MPITRKDGTDYRLRSPNPLSLTQNSWVSDVEKINFKWKPQVVTNEEEQTPAPMQSDMKVKDEYKDLSSIDTPVAITEDPEQIAKEPVVQPDPVVKTDSESKPSVRQHLANTVHMHCLPVETISMEDSFYGDQFDRSSYGQKFTFESVMVEMGDLAMVFWTDIERVTEGSVVYPFRKQVAPGRYQPLQQYRWWKVTEIEEKSPGFLVRAIASDLQPDFS